MNSLKGVRYKLELWIDDAGDVEDEAFAYPVFARPADGLMPEQVYRAVLKYKPSVQLKAVLKAEQRAPVDVELAK